MAGSLGEFEQLIMLAVLRLGQDAYGVTIRRAIEESTGRSLSAGAVYTTLGRLEVRSLVSSRIGETVPERTGQRRKYYRVEPEGAAVLHQSYTNVSRMAEGVLRELETLAASANSRVE